MFVVLAVLDLRDIGHRPLGSGLGVAAVLAGYGAAQLVACPLVAAGRRPARSPVVVTQLLQVLVATNLRDTPGLALAVRLPAVVVLGCLLSPPVTRALASTPV